MWSLRARTPKARSTPRSLLMSWMAKTANEKSIR
jgi:hypothetical protein